MTLHLKPTEDNLEQAVKFLQMEEVVALPTETVYGLAGNAFSPIAVKKIFEAKERPSFDPLIVHVSDQVLKQPNPLHLLVDEKIISPEVLNWAHANVIEQAMKTFWPGPLTFILPRGSAIPNEVTSGQNTVGIRCPAHPVFQSVLSKLKFPLAAPSANRFGRISPTEALHVKQELDGRIAAVLDGGPCTVGVESSIIKIENPLKVTLLRPGKISIPELKKVFKVEIEQQIGLGQKNQEQITPGSLDEHYAPRKPLILFPESFLNRAPTASFFNAIPEDSSDAFVSMQGFIDFLETRKAAIKITLSTSGKAEEMAQKLFATLRELDQNEKVKVIFIDLPTEHKTGLGLAIADRLKRASKNKPQL